MIDPTDWEGRIYVGDCLEFMRQLPDGCVDAVVTDPPYKLSEVYGAKVDADNLWAVASLLPMMQEAYRVLRPGRFFVAFYDNRILPFLFKCAGQTRFTYLRSLYLYRRWGMASKWGGWMQTTDPIGLFYKPMDGRIRWGAGSVHHDCYIKAGPEEDAAGHPAQKPVNVTSDLLSWCSQPTDLILDPFLGSGTTAVVAERLGRRWIGCEINPEYAEMAQKRIDREREKLQLPFEAIA